MNKDAIPAFALIGLGQFGFEHYKELCRLEVRECLKLSGVFTKSGVTNRDIHHPISPISELTVERANGLDALIIATPANSHFNLINKFHKSCHLLIEKPIIDSPENALNLHNLQKNSSNLIVPAHNYRFHPAVIFAKSVIDQISTKIIEVQASFVNHEIRDKGGDPAREMLHALDIVQFLLKKPILSSYRHDLGRCAVIDCEYDDFWARYRLGFSAEQRRDVTISFSSHVIKIDFVGGIVSVEDLGKDLLTKTVLGGAPVSLSNQIETFCRAIAANTPLYPFASLQDACETVSATLKAPSSGKPRIAVIGGGVFGCQCAIELSCLGHVDIFERNGDILTEASLKNQWRHHSGFHYPLSFETVQEIKDCKHIFERDYADAIVKSVPSYYMVSSDAKEIPARRYLSSCSYNNLNFKIVPELPIVNPGSASITILTDEALYDIPKLREILIQRLHAADVSLCLNSTVVGGDMDQGQKRLLIEQNGAKSAQEYDIVVNCAYSEFGDMSSLFKVSKRKIRLEYVEMLELKLDLDPICLTFIDAPFLSLTYMLEKNRFFLSHRDHSVIKRSYDERISPRKDEDFISNRENIIRDACRYMPFLKDADVVRSWYCVKARSAYEKEFWEVPTIIKNHGFGYWSVLGGKILTCSKNAQDILREVRDHLEITPELS